MALAIIAMLQALSVTFDSRLRPDRTCPPSKANDVVVCAIGERNNTIPIRVNGVEGTMLIDPGGPTSPSCNSDFMINARVTGYGPAPIGRVGPIRINGRYDDVVYFSAGRSFMRATTWGDRPAVDGADCVMGPGGLDAAVVEFRLGPARQGQRTHAIPIYRPRRNQWDGRVTGRLDVAGLPVNVRFDTLRELTALTAPAARIIAPAYGGTVEGDVQDTDIWWGVRRPVRRLRTRQILTVGPLSLDTLYVRVSDYGHANALASVDPDEIGHDDVVVTGQRPRNDGIRILRVGRDDLSRCASIVFDKPAGQILLTC